VVNNIIWTIVISFIGGIIATIIRMIIRIVSGLSSASKELTALLKLSIFIRTTVAGAIGAFVATFIGQAIGWYRVDQGAGLIGATVGALVVLIIGSFVWQRRRKKRGDKLVDQGPVIIKNYTGSQAEATALFQADSVKMAERGYFPTSQSWAPGRWGFEAIVTALLLCFILFGILILICMLVVKPDGALGVTYELRAGPVTHEKTTPAA
jgi:uncharacterized membrane protein YeaQ/YmgE (transglycosylase-associated protein family)